MAPKTGDAVVEKPKDNKEAAAAEKKEGKDKDADAAADEELSEEDKQLKEDLELCVERLKENDEKLYSGALENMGRQVPFHLTYPSLAICVMVRYMLKYYF